ncbi:hypothetical protein [Helicobacter felis]|uniref:hypothetical protein n=1 Tax=Helicobacter felis TaxID=214 RepID=UPI000CF0E265|nr:hypothetical protein [Helicobacter felis]
MKIETADDLESCFDRFATLKAKFEKANLLAEFKEALELYSFIKELAHKASKMTEPLSPQKPNKQKQPISTRAQNEHKRRLEKIALLEQKEQEGSLSREERRRLKNFREAEKVYAEKEQKS